jgi:hypothetical protein
MIDRGKRAGRIVAIHFGQRWKCISVTVMVAHFVSIWHMYNGSGVDGTE